MAYRMSVSTEFSCVWNFRISNGAEIYTIHINIIPQDIVSTPFCFILILPDGCEFIRRGDQGIGSPVSITARCGKVIYLSRICRHIFDLCHALQINISTCGCTESALCSLCSATIDTAHFPNFRI